MITPFLQGALGLGLNKQRTGILEIVSDANSNRTPVGRATKDERSSRLADTTVAAHDDSRKLVEKLNEGGRLSSLDFFVLDNPSAHSWVRCADHLGWN